MKKVTIVAAVLALAGSAQAADLAVKAPLAPAYYDWSGIYVGANAGAGWADTTWNLFPNGNLFAWETTPKGGLAGGQIGINKQFGNWVWGVELTGDWAGLSQTVSFLPFFTNTAETKLHDLETLTSRLGYASNNWLLYTKFGGATGTVGLTIASIGGPASSSQDQRLWGFTSGVGIEYGLTHNFILGVEYDFTRLFAGQYLLEPFPVRVGASKSFDVQAVTGRVSYKF
jgi:outer membrane immunogenic protein